MLHAEQHEPSTCVFQNYVCFFEIQSVGNTNTTSGFPTPFYLQLELVTYIDSCTWCEPRYHTPDKNCIDYAIYSLRQDTTFHLVTWQLTVGTILICLVCQACLRYQHEKWWHNSGSKLQDYRLQLGSLLKKETTEIPWISLYCVCMHWKQGYSLNELDLEGSSVRPYVNGSSEICHSFLALLLVIILIALHFLSFHKSWHCPGCIQCVMWGRIPLIKQYFQEDWFLLPWLSKDEHFYRSMILKQDGGSWLQHESMLLQIQINQVFSIGIPALMTCLGCSEQRKDVTKR